MRGRQRCPPGAHGLYRSPRAPAADGAPGHEAEAGHAVRNGGRGEAHGVAIDGPIEAKLDPAEYGPEGEWVLLQPARR